MKIGKKEMAKVLIIWFLFALIIYCDRMGEACSVISTEKIFVNVSLDYETILTESVTKYVKNARDKESLAFLNLSDWLTR